jgi:hypothetical protein
MKRAPRRMVCECSVCDGKVELPHSTTYFHLKKNGRSKKLPRLDSGPFARSVHPHISDANEGPAAADDDPEHDEDGSDRIGDGPAAGAPRARAAFGSFTDDVIHIDGIDVGSDSSDSDADVADDDTIDDDKVLNEVILPLLEERGYDMDDTETKLHDAL